MKARVSEVFKSIQGEGIYQGISQIFIRFYGCNLNCRFCDTELRSYQEYDVDTLSKKINSFDGNYHSVSLTGGEPLLQIDFLKEFLPRLKNKKIYLETNGTLPDRLSKIIDMVDIIAMDIKLSSSTGLNDFWEEHEGFLEIALKKDVFVKTVICNSTELKDLKKAIKLMKNFNKDIPFVLQPNHFELDSVLMEKLFKFKEFSLRFLRDVRIIPQLHKFIGVK
ncbi:MAG: 7-carboxy-7-deazaguanine synthase QueE [Candidatus Omnitrophica bacterium]|nr:7-carboxy-7-deazaguanine synthase QueE [Candidatus Omnitrophota bacterium]